MATNPTTILVPVSGNTADESAVGLACELARHQKRATVLVLYVLNVPREMPLDAESPELGRVEAVLRRMEAIAKRNRCRAEGAMLQARDWGPAIVEEAKDRDAAVIVIGTPHEERFGIPSLGETIAYILKHSTSRVIVDREPVRRYYEGNGA